MAPIAANDPVASLTAWTPIRMGTNANFRAHVLVWTAADRMEFRAAATVRILGVALVATLLFPVLLIVGYPPMDWRGLWLFLLVSPFVAGGFLILHWAGSPIVFDRARGLFEARGKTTTEDQASTGRDVVHLDRVHALQLLSYRVPGTEAYRGCELNLVLEDGSRRKVLAHGDEGALRADTLTLGTFLGKPVWDVSGRVRRGIAR